MIPGPTMGLPPMPGEMSLSPCLQSLCPTGGPFLEPITGPVPWSALGAGRFLVTAWKAHGIRSKFTYLKQIFPGMDPVFTGLEKYQENQKTEETYDRPKKNKNAEIC